MVLMSGVMSVMVLMSAVMVLMSGVMLVMVLMLTVQQVSFSDVSGVTLMTVEVMVVQTQSSKKGYLNQTKTIQKGMLSICPEIPLDCPGLYSS
jgi:membrane protein implicated in regulation of membrane protease activity